jgi:hypothetical protein
MTYARSFLNSPRLPTHKPRHTQYTNQISYTAPNVLSVLTILSSRIPVTGVESTSFLIYRPRIVGLFFARIGGCPYLLVLPVPWG